MSFHRVNEEKDFFLTLLLTCIRSATQSLCTEVVQSSHFQRPFCPNCLFPVLQEPIKESILYSYIFYQSVVSIYGGSLPHLTG